MQRVTRDRISYAFDRRLEPALRVRPGEEFEVETEDARSGRCRAAEQCRPEYVKALRSGNHYYGNPVTGPVFVEGARPGDALAVHVRNVECDSQGFLCYWPFVYHLSDWLREPVTELVAIRDGHVEHTLQTASGPHALRLPLRPMIGCLGTAPELEVPTTSSAGRFGGNLDVPEVASGTTAYFPVDVPGGLLFLGDCHPYQGDGEVSGCEMRAVLRVAVDVIPGGRRSRYGVRIETPTHLVTVGADRPAESAQWLAIREMILWLEERYGWTKEDARKLLTLTGDLRPGQIQVGPYTMRMIVPKGHLPAKSDQLNS